MTDTPQEIANECFDIYLTEMGIGIKERRLIIDYANKRVNDNVNDSAEEFLKKRGIAHSAEFYDTIEKKKSKGYENFRKIVKEIAEQCGVTKEELEAVYDELKKGKL